jgi:hypothetical protein
MDLARSATANLPDSRFLGPSTMMTSIYTAPCHLLPLLQVYT